MSARVLLGLLVSLSVGCGAAAPSPLALPEKGPIARAMPACPTAIAAGVGDVPVPPIVGARIARVCFVGQKRVTFELLRAALLSAEGQPFDEETVRRDVRRLYRLGDLEDVRVLADTTDAGVVVVYAVRERPLLQDVRFEGAKAIDGDEVRRMMSLSTGAPFDPAALARRADLVRAEYVSRGYARATVETKIEPSVEGEVRLRVILDEGPRVVVSNVAFKGMKKISEKDLRRAVQTHAGDVYRDDQLARDALLVRMLYLDRGMLNAVVVGPTTAAASPDQGAVTVTFDITEGPIFKLGKVGFAGDLAASAKDYAARLRSRSGQVFRRSELMEDIQRMIALHKERGHDVDVSPETTINARTDEVDVVFRVTKSRP